MHFEAIVPMTSSKERYQGIFGLMQYALTREMAWRKLNKYKIWETSTRKRTLYISGLATTVKRIPVWNSLETLETTLYRSLAKGLVLKIRGFHRVSTAHKVPIREWGMYCGHYFQSSFSSLQQFFVRSNLVYVNSLTRRISLKFSTNPPY